MALEWFGIRLIDPASLVERSGRDISSYYGLPGYYTYWVSEGSIFRVFGDSNITRLGGLALNPPIAGVVTAVALVFLWHTPPFPWRRALLPLLGLATLLTFSRGGWLIVLLGVFLPVLVRRIGVTFTTALTVPAIWLVGQQVSEDGNSSSHANGLLVGLNDAFESGIGVGFGRVGNLVSYTGQAVASESLAGIAFSASGIVMVVIILALLLVLIGRLPTGSWEPALAIGILIAALLSESAGAVNGTIPAWLAIGVVLQRRCPGVLRLTGGTVMHK
jgi:hypothetical protein